MAMYQGEDVVYPKKNSIDRETQRKQWIIFKKVKWCRGAKESPTAVTSGYHVGMQKCKKWSFIGRWCVGGILESGSQGREKGKWGAKATVAEQWMNTLSMHDRAGSRCEVQEVWESWNAGQGWGFSCGREKWRLCFSRGMSSSWEWWILWDLTWLMFVKHQVPIRLLDKTCTIDNGSCEGGSMCQEFSLFFFFCLIFSSLSRILCNMF